MSQTCSLPDLDGLDPAALKTMLLAQHDRYQAQQDHFQAQHERYTATLSSRATEIQRLVLLVAKLKQMLFGRKSEKVFRQIEQMSSSSKTCRPPAPSEKRRLLLSGSVLRRRSPSAVLCPSIFCARSTPIGQYTRHAPIAVAGCVSWAKM